MNKYLIYLLGLNIVTNGIAFVPRMLIEARYDNLIASILIASVFGVLTIYIYSNAMNHFPEQSLPDILRSYTHKAFYTPYLMFLGFMWFVAGSLTLLVFVKITARFISPDTDTIYVLFFYLILVVFGALLKSMRLLYAVEFIMLMCVPLIIIILIKAYTNQSISWDSIRIVATHYNDMPSVTAISAAFYAYLGFSNIVVFNKNINTKVRKRDLLLIGTFGVGSLITTAIVPIGLQGIDWVDQLLYPWITTSDSLRIEFAFIERVIYIFVLLYIAFSTLSITVHWHVSINLVKPIMKKKLFKLKRDQVLTILFIIVTIFGNRYLNEENIFMLGEMWIMTLVPANLIGVLVILWMVSKQKKKAA